MEDQEITLLCDRAAYDIAKELLFFRVPVRDWKEKYGTVRVYTGFGVGSLHSLILPNHMWYRWSKKPLLKWLDEVTLPIFSLLLPLTIRYHEFIYRAAYQRAIEKYPEIRENILDGADYDELLENL